MTEYREERTRVIRAAKWLSAKGYLGAEFGSAGNVSARIEGQNLAAITPSGRPYTDLTPEDVCVIDFDCNLISGKLRPSIESGLHLAVLKNRPETKAVIHTHQHYAGVLAVLNLPIPPLFDEVSLYLGNEVEVAPYGISGSETLANNVAGLLGNGCDAYLLQNHGALCLGKTMDEALRNVELLEKAAETYYHALVSGREIGLLPRETIKRFDEMRRANSKG